MYVRHDGVSPLHMTWLTFGQAALHGGLLEDAKIFGWRTGFRRPKSGVSAKEDRGRREGAHDWETMVTAVQNHIKGLNFKYRTNLRSNGASFMFRTGFNTGFGQNTKVVLLFSKDIASHIRDLHRCI